MTRPSSPDPTPDRTGPVTHCVLGETLCVVYVLSEAEYAALPPECRPAAAEHVPGLGWIVALRGRVLRHHGPVQSI